MGDRTMKRNGHVVIGANFGDEGKGLLTDFIAARDPDRSLVVRFNGGAQAGHTVVTPDGRRHVFSHFGSGTLDGSPTYLSRFFIVNPLLFIKEWRQLAAMKVYPQILMDADCLVTTPFDVFINQLKEMQRGSTRHGSCGAGINETVTRCLRAPQLMTQAKEFADLEQFRTRLLTLAADWLPARIKELHLESHAHESQDARGFLQNVRDVIGQYICDVQRMLRYATIISEFSEYPLSSRYESIIFEGAQGLLLDEDRIDRYPHLTRSKTGLFNVMHLAPRLQIDHLQVTYMTRTYLTRHGAGPLAGERHDWTFTDETNITNLFQGTLRFAPLDLDELNHSISLDLSAAKFSSRLSLDAGIGITCADQLNPPDPARLCLPIRYISFGPARSDVRCLEARPNKHIFGLEKFAPAPIITNGDGDRKAGTAIPLIVQR